MPDDRRGVKDKREDPRKKREEDDQKKREEEKEKEKEQKRLAIRDVSQEELNEKALVSAKNTQKPRVEDADSINQQTVQESEEEKARRELFKRTEILKQQVINQNEALSGTIVEVAQARQDAEDAQLFNLETQQAVNQTQQAFMYFAQQTANAANQITDDLNDVKKQVSEKGVTKEEIQNLMNIIGREFAKRNVTNDMWNGLIEQWNDLMKGLGENMANKHEMLKLYGQLNELYSGLKDDLVKLYAEDRIKDEKKNKEKEDKANKRMNEFNDRLLSFNEYFNNKLEGNEEMNSQMLEELKKVKKKIEDDQKLNEDVSNLISRVDDLQKEQLKNADFLSMIDEKNANYLTKAEAEEFKKTMERERIKDTQLNEMVVKAVDKALANKALAEPKPPLSSRKDSSFFGYVNSAVNDYDSKTDSEYVPGEKRESRPQFRKSRSKRSESLDESSTDSEYYLPSGPMTFKPRIQIKKQSQKKKQNPEKSQKKNQNAEDTDVVMEDETKKNQEPEDTDVVMEDATQEKKKKKNTSVNTDLRKELDAIYKGYAQDKKFYLDSFAGLKKQKEMLSELFKKKEGSFSKALQDQKDKVNKFLSAATVKQNEMKKSLKEIQKIEKDKKDEVQKKKDEVAALQQQIVDLKEKKKKENNFFNSIGKELKKEKDQIEFEDSTPTPKRRTRRAPQVVEDYSEELVKRTTTNRSGGGSGAINFNPIINVAPSISSEPSFETHLEPRFNPRFKNLKTRGESKSNLFSSKSSRGNMNIFSNPSAFASNAMSLTPVPSGGGGSDIKPVAKKGKGGRTMYQCPRCHSITTAAGHSKSKCDSIISRKNSNRKGGGRRSVLKIPKAGKRKRTGSGQNGKRADKKKKIKKIFESYKNTLSKIEKL